MQAALSQLSLPSPPPDEYGKDLPLDDDDLDDDDLSSEDLFSEDGDGEFYYSSEGETGDLNQDWLPRKCAAYCSRHTEYGLRPDELETNLLVLLAGTRGGMWNLCQ